MTRGENGAARAGEGNGGDARQRETAERLAKHEKPCAELTYDQRPGPYMGSHADIGVGPT